MSSPTRWAGVPLSDRRAERRELVVAAAFALLGDEGVGAVTVRSVCREAKLNSRYFYECFPTVDDLLGAVCDHVVGELAEAVMEASEEAGELRDARARAGIKTVLAFTAADPRRGRILFTEARSHPVLAQRLLMIQGALYQAAIEEDDRRFPDADPLSNKVGAALFTGAMTELVVQWLAGGLGEDVDAVTDFALERVMAF